MPTTNENVRKRGNKWCAYVDDKLTKAEKEANPKKHKGKKVGSVQKTPSGKIRMKARACYTSKKKANNAMAAAMMECTELRAVIREFVELQTGLDFLFKLSPHITAFLEGLISAEDTKERVLAMLVKFKGYRDSIPPPIHRAMETIVPGFRSFEHFEEVVMKMSENELDSRLTRLLSLIQLGTLAGVNFDESLLRETIHNELLVDSAATSDTLIQEKVLSDISPLKEIPPDVNRKFSGGGGIYYGDKRTTDWRRSIKRDWNTHADNSFFQDPKQFQVIHYLGYYSERSELSDYFSTSMINRMYIDAGINAGLLSREDESIEMFMTDPDFYDEIVAKMPNALRIPGIHIPSKDELSCFGYVPPRSIDHIANDAWDGFFTFKKYRVTFVSNEDAGTERLSNAERKDRERMYSSGLAKRPSSEYNPKDAPLDKEGLSRNVADEVVIDNWVIDTYCGPKKHREWAERLGLKFKVWWREAR